MNGTQPEKELAVEIALARAGQNVDYYPDEGAGGGADYVGI